MIIRARAPLRLGLGGGGTDVAPFCDMHGGYVLNATIDKYAYAIIKTNNEGQVRFVAADQKIVWEDTAQPYFIPDGNLDLHKGVYNRIIADFNGGQPIGLTLTTFTDAPPGSGLGSSSTLVVAMVKAFVEFLNLPLGDYEIAHLSYEVERIDIGLNGGKQDQYAATFGGINFMEFYDNDRVVVNPLRVKNWILAELETSLVLYYTGVSRNSAKIIDEQSINVKQGNTESLDAMFSLKQEAMQMKESLLKGELTTFAQSMGDSWHSKKRTAHNITNSAIDATYQAALNAGALSGKISGAGGGGFMMFFVEPTRRMEVVKTLQEQGGQVFNCHFTKHGSQGWRL